MFLLMRSFQYLLGVTIGILPLILATGVRAQAVDPVCSQPFNPYLVSSTTLQNCGVRTFARQQITALPDGGKEYVYNVYGDKVVYRIPPAGFDPRSASDDTLRFYGLPPRPSSADALQAWAANMGQIHFVVPPQALASAPFSGAASSAATVTGTDKTANWSGYIDKGSTKFSNADGIFNQPYSGNSTQSCTDEAEVTWSGLGGYGTKSLAQDGTAMQTPGVGEYQGWIEVLPDQPSVVAQPISARPGYAFEAATQWSGPQLYGTPYYTFYMEDYYSRNVIVPQVYTNTYDGSTAEFVQERPTVNNQLTALLNVSYVEFTQAGAADVLNGSLHPVTYFSHAALTMGPGNLDSTLAHAGGLFNSGNSFYDYYDHCD